MLSSGRQTDGAARGTALDQVAEHFGASTIFDGRSGRLVFVLQLDKEHVPLLKGTAL